MTPASAERGTDIEKVPPVREDPEPRASVVPTNHDRQEQDHSARGLLHRFERTLLKYNIEARGIQRVEDHEKQQTSLWTYIQVFVLWTSVNLVVNNITLGMLGPAVYSLSFTDSALTASFGSLLGSVPVAWIATFGPASGIRTMIFSRYSMGWWPSKITVILNILQMLGYSLIVSIIGGQVLSAVSPNGSMSVIVGIVIICAITWLVTTFGIAVFHYYERFAWIPQLIVLCILYGVSAKSFDLTFPSQGTSLTIAGNRLSFFSICLSAGITYAPLSMDYFVYYSPRTSRTGIFASTLLGLWLSFTFSLVLGAGIASGLNDPNAPNPAYSTAYTSSSGGSSSGALLVQAYAPLGSFGKFCAVVVALGGIANMIAPTYSSGVDFQILGRPFARVPRVVWNTIGVIIFFVCAVAGRDKLAVIFTNFLALMGYWVAIWVAIIAEEYIFFRGGFRVRGGKYDWTRWDDERAMPVGIAALVAFLVGWAGAILCMAQVWYIGPLAKLVGEYGGDMGNYVGFGFAAVVYPGLRWVERTKFGR